MRAYFICILLVVRVKDLKEWWTRELMRRVGDGLEYLGG